MNKYISLYTQKKLLWIPYANYSIWFIWLYNYYQSERDTRIFLRSWPVIIICVLPVLLAFELAHAALAPDYLLLSRLLKLSSMYCYPLALGAGLIKYQEKTIFDTESDK